MSIDGLSKADIANVEVAATETQAQITRANERIASFMYGAQKLMLEESVFLSNELLDRAQTEMHLFSELVSKMVGAHSVKDIRTMYEECGKHQLEFIRRDYDRMLRHGGLLLEATSDLLNNGRNADAA